MIENDDDRLITFSQRKPFTFGHPSIESIANFFLNKNIPMTDNTHALIEAHRKVRTNKVI
ncbi:hypothetical protein Godav_009938 [Gossypium davidsonii]|uniref:Uncharacterized protein n=2 Tax=Gossypium TaxID=3633 RepID=A0A7J8SEQ4_GOSDV|nr:hypothetical protein [Gossypium davidsonii]MBA0660204.1 hypothetical protein [Gossypium klotzschianum]